MWINGRDYIAMFLERINILIST